MHIFPSFRFPNNNNVGTNDPNPEVDFESAICLGEFDECDTKEECNLPTELLRMVEREDKQILPHKETIEILNLGIEKDRKEVKIGTTLSTEARHNLIVLLQEYREQKLRRMQPEMLLKIKEEVKKQFDVGFVQVAKYPEWVANIVHVPKKDRKVRMCIDYRDLNKASPNDNFPLPHIDTLVDNTAGNNYFSFMDGFSGYNQIKMHPEDMEKTTFVTMWGTYCYKVMPFGLKNAGATYQRAMMTLFHDMMHKEIEVYVDDMIVKAQTESEHVEYLRKLFHRLRKFQLRLNPSKCTFGVISGKLLGFVVSRKGIVVDPDKLTDNCDPNFRLLRKNSPGAWDENCQIAFKKVKEYLSNSPILMSLILGKPLFLYLSIFENSIWCVMGQNDESGRKERAIYYLSKKFTDCEVRYPPIEKVCCALVWDTKTLRQYMLLARWHMLLSEFDIEYVNQKAIKGSAISDFLANRTDESYEPLNFDFSDEDLMALSLEEVNTSTDSSWKMYFDGESNALGHGIGAILISPDGSHYPFTSRLNFDCTNNMAEYEACICGEWETKDKKLMEYRKLILDLLEEFDEVTFHYVPREENQMADALATLASAFKVGGKSEMMSIDMQSYEYPAHCYQIEEVKDTKPWMAAGYVLDREVLYKKSHNQVLLRCIDAEEAKMIMEEIYGDKINVPLHSLHVMTSPWPFSMWGMDVIGQIHPKASNGHRFILVAIDYFTKWVEVASYAACEQFNIKHHNSTTYRPKMNDAVEAANKNIKRIVEKTIETYKDWHEKLSFALFAYRTSTGATPFSLAYGMEAVLPIEVEIPSLRVLTEVKLDDAEWVQSRYDQLNLIDERRLKAIYHGQIYQKQMIRAHDKKVLAEMDGPDLPHPINSDAVKKYFAYDENLKGHPKSKKKGKTFRRRGGWLSTNNFPVPEPISTSRRRILDLEQYNLLGFQLHDEGYPILMLNFTTKGPYTYTTSQRRVSYPNGLTQLHDIGVICNITTPKSSGQVPPSRRSILSQKTIQRPLVKSFELVFNFTTKDFVLRIFQF
ncbi:Detected protein of unknown function [Hibiscus syriacus]|uniref:Reverse transcriptase domain-containing protein n=1 Tax=Hibiscus syriacus TaxID=106335 RepID=A0A6A2YPU0_HIBSY|nr:Detected protein of unknown function [Hibiscus syriacus]